MNILNRENHDRSDRSTRLKRRGSDRGDSNHQDITDQLSYLDQMYQRLKHLLYNSYYRARQFNYSHKIYPINKKIEDISFRSYDLYNLHGGDELLSRMLDECDSEEVIFDVGANIGTYSLALASKYPRSDILAFEPNIETFEKLENNLDCNGFSNITIHNMGISDQNGEMSFYISSYPETSSFSKKSSERWGGRVKSVKKVDVRRLDTIVEETKKCPDRIKLDVEGHGLKVLKGGEKTLEECRPVIYMERHEVGTEKNESELEEFLDSLGYSIDKRDKIWVCRSENSKV